ncbi:MAG: hypothetical protein U0Q16_18820 [Bryobacteraceae bacterium]
MLALEIGLFVFTQPAPKFRFGMAAVLYPARLLRVVQQKPELKARSADRHLHALVLRLPDGVEEALDVVRFEAVVGIEKHPSFVVVLVFDAEQPVEDVRGMRLPSTAGTT